MTVQQRVREGGIRESKICVCACVHAYRIFYVVCVEGMEEEDENKLIYAWL